jgi:two-component system, OmpR family, sensor histidine kinase MprB
MSLRARMGLASGVAVALAVIAVAVTAYAGTRSELTGQVDNSLRTLATPILENAGVLPRPPGGPGPGAADGQGAAGGQGVTGPPGATGGSLFGAAGQSGTKALGPGDCDGGLGLDVGRGGAFGGAQGLRQLVSSTGAVCVAAGQSAKIPVDAATKALAKTGSGVHYTDAQVGSTHLRVAVYGVGSHGALMVALPLTDVDKALHNQLLLMVIIAAAGIALAALFGFLVARTALAPIARFTRRTESIATAPDPSQRLEVMGGDELARLATTFNATLDSLEAAVDSQRNLVADASHELRTPIASLRANLQLMRDESRLAPEDRDALREDMIEELDELTGLVGDVVELARGGKPSGAMGDVRLDAIVADLAERTQRRAPELDVRTEVEPTLVRGEPDRIARAVANLLDNARKWSPPGGKIEVALKNGTVTVRDHGPGFHAEDLPFVFDRFHRAKDARAKPGSGLGLAIVRQAAEAHGGSVEAGNAPGGGAILTVSFGRTLEIEQHAPETPVSAS